MKYIEIRVYIKKEYEDEIEIIAEQIKDELYDRQEHTSEMPINDVTYEFKNTE